MFFILGELKFLIFDFKVLIGLNIRFLKDFFLFFFMHTKKSFIVYIELFRNFFVIKDNFSLMASYLRVYYNFIENLYSV